jgi:hypothetical protein
MGRTTLQGAAPCTLGQAPAESSIPIFKPTTPRFRDRRVTCRAPYPPNLQACLWLRASILFDCCRARSLSLALLLKFPFISPLINLKIPNIASVACGAKDTFQTARAGGRLLPVQPGSLFPPPAESDPNFERHFRYNPLERARLTVCADLSALGFQGLPSPDHRPSRDALTSPCVQLHVTDPRFPPHRICSTWKCDEIGYLD